MTLKESVGFNESGFISGLNWMIIWVPGGNYEEIILLNYSWDALVRVVTLGDIEVLIPSFIE